MHDHDEFVELCALTAIGDLTAEQRQRLEDHAACCAECRVHVRQFRDLVQNWVPLADDTFRHVPQTLFMNHSSRRAREAFLSRARREGLQLTAITNRNGGIWSAAPWVGVRLRSAPLLLIATVLLVVAGVTFRPRWHTVPPIAVPQPTTTQTDLDGLKTDLAAARKLNVTQAATVAALERDRSAAVDRSRTIDQLLQASQKQSRELQQELAQARLDSTDAQQRFTAELRKSEELNNELTLLRDAHAQDQASAVAAQFRIQEVSDQIKLQTAALEHERELLAAGRDIRDVMSARNLHILDVHDFDLKGKAQKSFGRVFYTEGKSLIFYAYDLPTKLAKNASFQAWGQRADGSSQAINLGLFYVDDQKQSRWALKFDNPDVLRQIDSVFVSIEPAGGTKQPSGQKLLYAWLGNDPNHP